MDFKEIKKMISKYNNIVILRHVQPDGDAYGSSFGMKEIIKDNFEGKNVYCLGEKVADFEQFFGKLDSCGLDVLADCLYICLDNPTLERLDFEHKELLKNVIKIDHHIFVETYGQIEWVDTNFSSACEMVTTMAKELKLEVSSKAATYLYLGLLTDAGRFLYSYTPNLFEAAKFLVEHGADVARIHPFIYEQDIKSTRFHGFCQSNFSLSGYGVGYNKLTPELLQSVGIDPHNGAGMVNALSNMKGVEIWAHFSEIETGGIRAEIRSKGLPVNLVANEFGGGGHKQAAGCTLMNWDEVDNCIAKLDNLIYESFPYNKQMTDILNIVDNASKIALDIYNNARLDIEIKEDRSPVTQADKNTNEYVIKTLKELYPDYGILSEETEDNEDRLNKEYCFIIDPVDGTKDFIAHDDEWSINIALARNGKIVCAAIGVPAKNLVYYAIEGCGAYKNENGVISRIHTSEATEQLLGLKSHYHVSDAEEKYFKQFNNLFRGYASVGSAYKYGLIAEGKANMNVKLAEGTKEWDIAPGVLIVKEAGGSFTQPNGDEFTFNKKDVYNHDGLIVMGKFNKGLLK